MKESYTTQELVALLDVTRQAIDKKANAEGWQSARREGRGGGFVWLVESMPRETVERIVTAEVGNLPAVAGAPGKVVALPFAKNVAVPEWALILGLLKGKIVFAWRAACVMGKMRGEMAAVATEQFLLALQAGVLPELGKEVLAGLGCEVTAPTLYRWNKVLRAAGDRSDALADRRGGWQNGPAKGLGQLSEAQEILFLKLWLNDRQPTVKFVWNTMKGLVADLPSYPTVLRFAERFERTNYSVVVMAREGEKAWTDKCGPYISRDMSVINVGDCLVADGHKCNFTMLNPMTGKPCRFTLVGWMDMKSTMPIGFDFCVDENTVAVSSSLHTAILNLGRIPSSVLIDNGGAFANEFFDGVAGKDAVTAYDGLYARLGIMPMHSAPYNARSKPIERMWRDFDENCARLLPSYSGNNIENKPAHLKRNEKFLQEMNPFKVPTVEEVVEAVKEYCRWKALQPHPTIAGKTVMDVFMEGRGAGFTSAELEKMRKTFLARKECAVSRCRVRVAGIEYEADCLMNIKGKVWVHYSFGDLSRVYLYDGEIYLGEAMPVTLLHPVAKLGTGRDMEQVKAANSRIKSLRKGVRKLVREVADVEAPALLGLGIMQGASERRVDVTLDVLPEGSVPVAAVAAGRVQAALPENEGNLEEKNAEFAAKLAALKAAKKPDYVAPAYFSNAAERYEWLFSNVERKGLHLNIDDAAFYTQFEATEEYCLYKGRYEKIRQLYKGMAAA